MLAWLRKHGTAGMVAAVVAVVGWGEARLAGVRDEMQMTREVLVRLNEENHIALLLARHESEARVLAGMRDLAASAGSERSEFAAAVRELYFRLGGLEDWICRP